MKYLSMFLLALFWVESVVAASPGGVNPSEIMANDSRQLFDGLRSDLHIPDALLVDAISEHMGPIKHNNQTEQFALVDSCRPQSCMEKIAAAVSLNNKKLIAVAFRTYRCRLYILTPEEIERVASNNQLISPSTCDKAPRLSMFVVRYGLDAESLTREAEAVKELRKWGRKVGYSREEIKVIVPKQS